MVVIILFSGQQRDADIKNRFGHSRVMILESSMEIYMLLYVKQIARGNLLCATGNQIWCSVTT